MSFVCLLSAALVVPVVLLFVFLKIKMNIELLCLRLGFVTPSQGAVLACENSGKCISPTTLPEPRPSPNKNHSCLRTQIVGEIQVRLQS